MANKDPPSPPYLADNELPNIRHPKTTPTPLTAGSARNNLIQQQARTQHDGLTMPFLTSPADLIRAKQKQPGRPTNPQHPNPTPQPQTFTPSSYNSHTATPIFNNPMMHQPTPNIRVIIPTTADNPIILAPHVDSPIPSPPPPPHFFAHPVYTPHPSMPDFSQAPHAQHPQYLYMPYPYPFPHFPNPAPQPPPPHPATPPDHHSSPDSYHRPSQYDYRLRRMEEADRRNASTAMGNVVKMIQHEHRLLADGKNYRKWAPATADNHHAPEKEEEEEPSEVDANAVRHNNCHICRQPGHYANDCPSRKKPPAQRPNQHYNKPPYSSYPNQYHSYCPIIVAPNFSPYGHVPQFPPNTSAQRQNNLQQHHQTPNPTPLASQNPPRGYDSYKTAYPRQRPQSMTAKNVDVGNIDNELTELQMNGDPSADAVGFAPEVITDTGASNHLTGNRLALSDFRTFHKPIPLRVATDGCRDCVTGMGTLIFPGRNGMTVSVKGVMYCEQARSTLISPSALRWAKLTISYDSQSDAFLFKSPEGELLLESFLDRLCRSWTLPQPIRPASMSSPPSVPKIPVSTFTEVSSNVFTSPEPMTHHDTKTAMPISLPDSSEISSTIFSFPVNKPNFDWHASDLTKDETELLFWHCLFGHCGLRRICKMIKLKLGIGLPEKIPTGDIKCPVCMIAKGTRTNTLLPTYRPVMPLDIIAADLMGPFEIPTFGGGKYVLAIRDIATSYSKVKILRTKGEAYENTVQQQELLQEQIDKHCKTPSPATPKTYRDILKHPDKEAWLGVIQDELQNLFRHQTWTIELVPDGKRVMGSELAPLAHPAHDGKLIKLKAWYVAKGYAQIAGVEFQDTFAPTATSVTDRLTVTAKCNWPVYSFDFVAAYLHSLIDEEVWVRPPEGLDVPKGYACKLMKALYAPPAKGAIWVHVGDGVVSGSNDDILQKLENELKDCLEIKWTAGVETIVGVKVTRTAEGFLLRQKKLVDNILQDHWDRVTVA
ncbi:hypothetical protein PSTG_08788 [Puccinia striiformis f. sp. tritici PST-78]|uniref:CCHC-type domain-containing protein n=1 Tax=Puccinia striiformis f. sp. tritici PST-78 TaxID=1165861 RepID=A0A0L0VF62_9BASI|nr:hypothetical protein PSTG_08788 [Puccinia striiformis f. sp. tritici PST-78]